MGAVCTCKWMLQRLRRHRRPTVGDSGDEALPGAEHLQLHLVEMHWRSFLGGSAATLFALAGLSRDQPVSLLNWCSADTRPDRGLRVVITGSSRELGFSLARQFVSLGDAVVISGRTPATLEAATAALRAEFPGCRVLGVQADASNAADVERLADAAAAELGGIDVWVCNAGQSQQVKRPLAETAPGELQSIVDTNLMGALLGARAAIARMQQQEGGGNVFFVDGNGSWGNPTPGNAAYGATKRALPQLRDSLAAEAAAAAAAGGGTGGKVGVHVVSPGMVATELLFRYADTPRKARNINIIAEGPDEVAAWLVPRMRGVEGSGRYIRYLTIPEVLRRYATASQRKGRFIPED
ncbi:putative chlorophyll(ide) b reductase chloroplastic [Chlorella sorokiniana]|uniref:Chlorophyll(Ide) b reductase chloroplastic n=1 Tax=Chlorella sorokiniana TaxID=3076 RepID=A0A2P6U2A6_CHLSO|nr:putative chlorophyll(ide) b reductase chloroplastic [Chlorella sorokiniana]|eukprot:PRW60445.1 putative chlorophyll(ide) b reductase chloroplastic [Chlorella sorokiniana]